MLRFYEHRARRLLPAMAVALVFSIVLGLLVMTSVELQRLARDLAATGLNFANILYWYESGYFAPAAQLNPLLHTWSLSLEEQYYLVFPILFVALVRHARRWMIMVLAGLALLSFAACVLIVRSNPSFAYFMLPTRAWELLAGALCAFVAQNHPLVRHPRLRAYAASLGLLTLLAAAMLIDKTTPFPSAWALLPVGGTVLIILFAAGTPTGALLSQRPMVWIGLISYSTYLLHQPVIAAARLVAGTEPPLWLMMALAGLSFVLGWAGPPIYGWNAPSVVAVPACYHRGGGC